MSSSELKENELGFFIDKGKIAFSQPSGKQPLPVDVTGWRKVTIQNSDAIQNIKTLHQPIRLQELRGAQEIWELLGLMTHDKNLTSSLAFPPAKADPPGTTL